MSMFFCAKCDNLRDADDGCEEAPSPPYPKFQLICEDCISNEPDEDDAADAYANAAHPLVRHDKPFSAEQQAIIDAHEAEADDDGP